MSAAQEQGDERRGARASTGWLPPGRAGWGTGRVALGVVLAVAGVAVAAVLARRTASAGWDADLLEVALSLRGGGWRLARGVLATLVIPALFVLAAGAVVVAHRRASTRVALLVGGEMVAANLAVQALKHPLRPLVAGLDPLSGHVGIVTAVALAWVVVVPARRRVSAAVVAAVLVAVVSAGVVVAGWHTVPQVLAPLAVGTGGALVLMALVTGPPGRRRGTGARRRTAPHRVRPGAVAAVALAAAAALGAFGLRASLLPAPTLALALALACVSAAAVAAVAGVVLALAGRVLVPRPPRRGAAPGSQGDERSTPTPLTAAPGPVGRRT